MYDWLEEKRNNKAFLPKPIPRICDQAQHLESLLKHSQEVPGLSTEDMVAKLASLQSDEEGSMPPQVQLARGKSYSLFNEAEDAPLALSGHESVAIQKITHAGQEAWQLQAQRLFPSVALPRFTVPGKRYSFEVSSGKWGRGSRAGVATKAFFGNAYSIPPIKVGDDECSWGFRYGSFAVARCEAL